MRFAHFSLFALSILGSSLVLASEYPADYPMFTDCQTTGNTVRICRQLQGSGAVALNLDYQGPLATGAPVAVWVKINYQDGPRSALFPMNVVRSSTGKAYYSVRVTNGCLVGMLGGCAKSGTPAMGNLLFWAGAYGMRLNRLDVETAFVDASGRWDSGQPSGSNFRFTFPQH